MHRNGSVAVTILLASELSTPEFGLELSEIKTRLHAGDPALRVAVVPALRQRFEQLIPAAVEGGASRIVLGLETGDYPTATLQLEARKAGLDPLGIEIVNFGAYPVGKQPHPDAARWVVAVLSGAIAKVRAFSGSRPENFGPVLPKQLSRRALFSLPVLEYRAMPSIQRGSCRARDSCQQCVRACPHGALTISDGFVHLDKSTCTGCGICVTACPHEAVDLPGSSPAQLSAQVSALLGLVDSRAQPFGILFHCRHSAQTMERLVQDRALSMAPNWLPVQLPCVGMATASWLLAPIGLGAAVVGVLPCHSNGCPSDKSARVQEHVTVAQQLFWLLGETDERVMTLSTDGAGLAAALQELPALEPLQSTARLPDNPLSHGSRSSVLLSLAGNCEADSLPTLDHPAAAFGVVEVNDGCTLCGVCAAACPTQALLLEESSTTSTLTFDSTACVGCEQCLPACPEDGVINVRRVIELRRLAEGRSELRRDTYLRCESCGKPIAATAMSRRVAAMLGDEHAGTVNVITRYCIDCRGVLR
jgi:ferredoxin